jgi:hypothetical protein
MANNVVVYPKQFHHALQNYTGEVMTFDQLHREHAKRDLVRSGRRFALWVVGVVFVAIYGGWL